MGINRTDDGRGGRRGFRGRPRSGRGDHARARRRRPAHDRHAAAQHAVGGPIAGNVATFPAGEWLSRRSLLSDLAADVILIWLSLPAISAVGGSERCHDHEQATRSFASAACCWSCCRWRCLGCAAYWWSKTLEPAAQGDVRTTSFATDDSRRNVVDGIVDELPGRGQGSGGRSADGCGQVHRSPEVLMFSFVASERRASAEEAWKEVTAAIAEKDGQRSEVSCSTTTSTSNLTRSKNGRAAYRRVEHGDRAGCRGARRLRAAVHVRPRRRDVSATRWSSSCRRTARSRNLTDLRADKVTFTRPDSNSGCKALLVLLEGQKNLLPERDYQWGFSQGPRGFDQGCGGEGVSKWRRWPATFCTHDEKSEVDEKSDSHRVQVGAFPPATIGYAYNLDPELRKAIREALVDFNWTAPAWKAIRRRGDQVRARQLQERLGERAANRPAASLQAQRRSSRR